MITSFGLCTEYWMNSAFGFVLHLIDLLSAGTELPYPLLTHSFLGNRKNVALWQ